MVVWFPPGRSSFGVDAILAFPRCRYFPIKGVAEPIRLALVAGGVDFEDNRLEQGTWPDLKASTPFGALPTLHLDSGEQLAQSDALLRYAGKLGGLYPKDDDVAAMRVDMWLGAVDDVQGAIRPTMYEKDDEKKMALRKVRIGVQNPD
jgi:glutathione S-transferase